jgi:glycosyltransferase involved in cell wall biosynthesis
MPTPAADGALQATVILPTIAGRGPLLPLSAGSVLTQTVRDIELFIMGDGVDDATRGVIEGLMAQDPRVRFFDHPKHPRRGEPNRHAALAEARGKIVCYLCDRDMMLPNHVETMLALLKDADFAHTLISAIDPEGRFRFLAAMDLADAKDRATIRHGWTNDNAIPLSYAGHTLAMYRRLPHGWRTTPDGQFTDLYMWEQFLTHPDCRAVSGTTPTVLYFPRYWRKDMTTEQKRAELQAWADRMRAPDWKERHLQLLIDGLSAECTQRGRWLRDGFLRRPLKKLQGRVRRLFGASSMPIP